MADGQSTLIGITIRGLPGEAQSGEEARRCFLGASSCSILSHSPAQASGRFEPPWSWLPEDTLRSRCEPVSGSKREGIDWVLGCHTFDRLPYLARGLSLTRPISVKESLDGNGVNTGVIVACRRPGSPRGVED